MALTGPYRFQRRRSRPRTQEATRGCSFAVLRHAREVLFCMCRAHSLGEWKWYGTDPCPTAVRYAEPCSQVLALRNCSFDFFELSDALSGHKQLRHVVLCPGRSRYTAGEVTSALLQLCQRAPSLRRVTLLHVGVVPGLRWDDLSCETVCDSVAQGLEQAGVGGKVELEVEDGSAETGLREEFEVVREEEWGREE